MNRRAPLMKHHLVKLVAVAILAASLLPGVVTVINDDRPSRLDQRVSVLPATEVRHRAPAVLPVGDEGAVAPAVSWPRGASGEAVVTSSVQRVGRTHTYVGGSTDHGDRQTSVRVTEYDEHVAQAGGIDGLVLKVEQSSRADTAATLQLDYADFADAGGAAFGERLHLVSLPNCFLTNPAVPSCQAATNIATTNNSGKHLLISSLAGIGNPHEARSTAVLAAVAGPSGSSGDFAATSLSPSGSWTAGGSSGNFTWNYPLAVPPVASGPSVAPTIAVTYDSASIDGRVASTNNQPGWLGEGWDYTPGYIERSYRTCSDNKQLPTSFQTGDLCWSGQILSMNVGGRSEQLVPVAGSTTQWRAEGDDGTQLDLVGAGAAGYQGEYWVMTTKDGTRSFFGRNVLPGATAGQATNSVWTEPVFGPRAADTTRPADNCYSSTGGFAASVCDQAWRWNLDMVEDPFGNTSAYYYNRELGYYGQNKGTVVADYVRGGTLDHIDYGLVDTNNSIYSVPSPSRITFTSKERCVETVGGETIACTKAGDPTDGTTFVAKYAKHWPDTPVDQNCKSSGTCLAWSPSYWSRKMLAAVASVYWTGTNDASGNPVYKTIDTYDFGHEFASTAADSSLQLTSIKRTGSATSPAIELPTVGFGYTLLDNRVRDTNGQSAMIKPRLTSILTDTGSVISVSFDQTDMAPGPCSKANLPADVSSNTQSCFPVRWTPEGYSDPIVDFFHKHLVTGVSVQDTQAISPTRRTSYKYIGGAAWHLDDNEVVPAKERTYGQFRGFQSVEVREGDLLNNSYGELGGGPSDGQTLTRYTYLRGMNTSVVDSRNHPAVTDLDQFKSRTFEVQVFNGSTGGEVSSTISVPKVFATNASKDRLDVGLAPLTADVVGVATEYKYTDVSGANALEQRTDTVLDGYARALRATSTATGLPPVCTINTYAEPKPASSFRQAITEVQTFGAICPVDGSRPNIAPLSDTKNVFDRLPAGQVSKGLNTETDTLVSAAPSHWARNTATFDSRGRVLSQTKFLSDGDTVGRTTSTTYTMDAGGLLARVRTAEAAGTASAQTKTSLYEPARQLTTATIDKAAARTDLQYDAMGRLITVWTGSQSKAKGDLASVTHSYTQRVDGPIAVTTTELVDPGLDANSNQRNLAYVTSVDLYDQSGQLRQTQKQALDGSGNRTIVDTFVDSHGWVVRSNNRWVTQGVPATELVKTTDSGIDSRTLTKYDGAGRATSVQDFKGAAPQRTSTSVYSGDRVTTFPPTGGVVTTVKTDAHGNEIEVDRWVTPPTVAANGAISGGTARVTSYTYTPLDQLVSTTSPTAQTNSPAISSVTYDLAGRTVSATDPDSGTSTMTYNDAGDVLTMTAAVGTSGARTVAFTLDPIGRRTAAYSGSVETGTQLSSWVYDTLRIGELTSTTRFTDAGQFTTTMTGYTSAGDPLGSTLTVPASQSGFARSYTTSQTWSRTHKMLNQKLAPGGDLPNETLDFSYDDLGLLDGTSGFTTYVNETTYSAYGEALRYELGTGNFAASLTYARDSESRRVTDVDLSPIASPSSFIERSHYVYDPSGNITSTTENQGPNATEIQCFNYDTLNQLKQAWSAKRDCASSPTASSIGGPQAYWMTWQYDNGGSRTRQTVKAFTGGPSTDTSMNYAVSTATHAHAIDTATTLSGTATTNIRTYTYNDDGSTRTYTDSGGSSGPTSLTYDVEGRTTAITSPNNIGTTYVYNTDGSVLERNVGAKKTLFLPGEEITWDTATNKVTGTRYYTHNGAQVAIRRGVADLTLVASDLNNTAQIAVPVVGGTALGAPTRRFFDAFGNPLTGAVSSWPGSRGFLNKTTSESTGLVDMGARIYDPVNGRFLSVDPDIGDDPRQANGYSYGWQNPLSYSDPAGTRPEGDHGDVDAGTWGTDREDPSVGKAANDRDDAYGHAAIVRVSPHVSVAGNDPLAPIFMQKYKEYANQMNYSASGGSLLGSIAMESIIWAAICNENSGLCGTQLTIAFTEIWGELAQAGPGQKLMAAPELMIADNRNSRMGGVQQGIYVIYDDVTNTVPVYIGRANDIDDRFSTHGDRFSRSQYENASRFEVVSDRRVQEVAEQIMMTAMITYTVKQVGDGNGILNKVNPVGQAKTPMYMFPGFVWMTVADRKNPN